MLIRGKMNELMGGDIIPSGSTSSMLSGDEDESASESETLKDFRQIELKTIERDLADWINGNGGASSFDIKAEFERTRDPLSGATVLHVCAAKGYNEVLVKLLTAFEGRIEVDSFRDCDGYTALHAAAFWKQPETFETLLKFGANPELLTAKTSENIIASSVLELCKNDPKFVQMIEINKEKEKIAKESETQRKIFAKRQREIRRSTQGVRKEDLEKALKIMEFCKCFFAFCLYNCTISFLISAQNSTSTSEQDFNSIMLQVNQAANESKTSLPSESTPTTSAPTSTSNSDTTSTPAEEKASSSNSNTTNTDALSNKTDNDTTTTWTIKLPPKLSLNKAEELPTIKIEPASTANNNEERSSSSYLRKSTPEQPSTPDTPPSVTMTISSTTPAEVAKRRRIKRRSTGIEDSESGLILSPEMVPDSVNPFESTGMSNSNSNSTAAATESVDAAFDVILSVRTTVCDYPI